jgi:hypothetical protein
LSEADLGALLLLLGTGRVPDNHPRLSQTSTFLSRFVFSCREQFVRPFYGFLVIQSGGSFTTGDKIAVAA